MSRSTGPGSVPPLDRALVDRELLVRPFDPGDRDTLVAGRDEEFHRFLGPGSPSPEPMACIVVDGTIVGWIDYDDDRHWLRAGEVNVGYGLFAHHRGRGHGGRALVLLCRWLGHLDRPLRPTLLIDPANAASLALARRAGFRVVAGVEGQLLLGQRSLPMPVVAIDERWGGR